MSHQKPLSAPQVDTSWDPQPFDPSQPASSGAVVQASQESETPSGNESEVPHTGPGGFVRIELYLHPEQLSHFFRAVVATQHAIMTLRETAAYLRISASRLRTLAEEGEVPAFLVEGHWRFAKHSVDEWIALQHPTEEESDVA